PAVALAPNDTMQLRIYPPPDPILRRLCDSPLEKIGIEVLPPMRKTARHNLRFRIPNRAPQHPVTPIFDGDYVAVIRFAENLQHFSRVNPVVAMQDSGARFDYNSGHSGNSRTGATAAKRNSASGSACPANMSAVMINLMQP